MMAPVQQPQFDLAPTNVNSVHYNHSVVIPVKSQPAVDDEF